MNLKDKIQKIIKPVLCTVCLVLTGCSAASMAQESTFESAYENGVEEEKVNIYTSTASVIIRSVNEEDQKISMYLINRNENRDMGYNGATVVQDKYENAMSIAQLKPGDIAEITYNSELERAGSITLSEDAWSYEGVNKYNLNIGNGNASIGDETFSIDNKVLVFADGHVIDTSQIINQDILTIRGKGHSIMSIIVEKGHGYLDIKNDEAVLGSFIEVGQTVISQIAPDMLITVPEGSYTVRITGEGIEELREVQIERNKETILDLGDIEVAKIQDASVKFSIMPSTAAVYVDEVKIDISRPARLPLGLHLVTATASGYDSLSQYFQIEEGVNTVRMTLEEGADISGNDIFSTEKEEPKITIESPVGAEVYQDNLYMGIAPVTYNKTAGDHTITLRKPGYITRSYGITVVDDKNDVTYAFPDLDPENSTVSGNSASGQNGNTNRNTNGNGNNNTVSGNSVSGNSVSGNSASGTNQ